MKKIKKLYNEAGGFLKKMSDDTVSAYSAQAAFFVIISFFPFTMLLMTLVRFIPVDVNVQTYLSDNLPNKTASDFLNGILRELSGKAANGALLGAMGVSALWSSSRCLLSIINGLNQIYGSPVKRSYIFLRLTSVVYILVLQLTVVVSLVILVFGERINDWLVTTLNISGLSDFIVNIRWLMGLLVLILFFMFIYTIVPERKTRFLSELPGAVISAFGWLGFTALFTIYTDNFSNYGALYGSLAAAVILMLWLYFCMYILFLGAEANVYLQSKRIGTLTVKEYIIATAKGERYDKGH